MKTTDIASQRRKLRIQSGGVWGDACDNFQFDILTWQGPYALVSSFLSHYHVVPYGNDALPPHLS
jgi:hypothetical protein